MTLRWIFQLCGSLSRVRDKLKEHGVEVALTMVLIWLKKAIVSVDAEGERGSSGPY